MAITLENKIPDISDEFSLAPAQPQSQLPDISDQFSLAEPAPKGPEASAGGSAWQRIARNPLVRLVKHVAFANLAPRGHEQWGVNPYFVGFGTAMGALAAPELTLPAVAAGALSGAAEDAFYQEVSNAGAAMLGSLAPNHPWARFLGGVAAIPLFHHAEIGRNTDALFAKLAGRAPKAAARELDDALKEAGTDASQTPIELGPESQVGYQRLRSSKDAAGIAANAAQAQEGPAPIDLSREFEIAEPAKPPATRVPDDALIEAERHPGTMVTTTRAGDLGVDPERFQYKLRTSGNGTRGELSGVEKWDDGLAGILTAWRDKHGKLWVVNGHHRLEKAKELLGGDAPLRVQVLDEGERPGPGSIPGMQNITAQMARSYGGLINIAEGRGTELDAAKLLRDEGFDLDELKRRGLSLKSQLVDRARGIANLDAPLFHAAQIGMIEPDAAAAIGRDLAGNAPAQHAIFGWLKKHPHAPSLQIANMARLAAEAPTTAGEATLFGPGWEKSQFPEQAEVIANIQRRLGSERALFGKAAKGAGTIEGAEAGKIDADRAAAIAAQRAKALDVYNRQVFSAGTPASAVAKKYAGELARAKGAGPRGAVIDRAYQETLGAMRGELEKLGETAPQQEMTLGASLVPPQAITAVGRAAQELREGLRTLRAESIDKLVPQRLPAGEFAARQLTMRTSQALERERLQHKALDGAVAALADLGPADLDRFNTAADTRDFAALGKLDPLWDKSARLMTALLDRKRDQLIALSRRYGLNLLRNYYEDYFPRQFKLPGDEVAQQHALGRWRQIVASKNWLKERKLRSYDDARELGLVPKYTNPALLVRDQLDDMDRYIAQLQLLHGDLRPNGLAKFIPHTSSLVEDQGPQRGLPGVSPKTPAKAPDGWQKLNFGGTRFGDYWAPPEIASVINRYLAPGLNRSPIYRGIRALNGGFNMVQLGFSGYHYLSESTAAIAHQFSRTLIALTQGRPIKALEMAAETPIAPIRMVRLGKAIEQFANDPQFRALHPEYSDYYRRWIDSGGDMLESQRFAARFSDDFSEQLKRIPVVGSLANNLLKAADLTGRPLFQYLIPNLKRAAFVDNLRDYIEANPGKSDAEISAEAYRIAKEGDDRFGMYNYDRLHLPHKLRDLIFVASRAPGWTLGNLRQVAYGVRDIPASLKGIAAGRGMTRNTAFLASSLMTYGLATALFNYAKTGRFPDYRKAYQQGGMRGAATRLFGYESGQLNPDGTPALHMLPGYPRDYASLLFRVGLPAAEPGDIGEPLKGAARIAGAKVSPVAGLIRDAITNKDYYGREIADPNQSKLRQMAQRLLLHPLAELTPFSAQMYFQQRQSAQSPSRLEAALGVQPMPRAYGETPLERALSHDRDRGTTPAQIARRKAHAQALAAARKGDPKGLRDALRSGQISMRDVHSIVRQAHLYRQSPLFEKLMKADFNRLLDKEPLVSDAQLPVYTRALQLHLRNLVRQRRLTEAQKIRYSAVMKELRERLKDAQKAG